MSNFSEQEISTLNASLWDLEICSDEAIPEDIKEKFPALFPIVCTRYFYIAGFCSLVPLTEDEVDFLQDQQDLNRILSYHCTQRGSGSQFPRQFSFMREQSRAIRTGGVRDE